ncbi:alpha/beta hydrolase [Arthrobacter sp. H20]|uniref:alpha/beta fold hydrolase n=1 Tax=Arthrobacter sp. H20 TaxID=1267981 RepID=UPI0004AFEB81|nr:alpha/beta hydrolase [Arthrobacter sp. H20]
MRPISGGADQPDGGYALAEQADDAAAVLDALGIRQALVLGSSSGGYIAQQLAVSQPQRVAALVLAGSPLTLRGRPEFADDVDRLSDPIDSGWVRNSLAWFPLQRAVPQWFVEDRVADGVGMPARVWKLTLDGFCRAIPPTEVGTIPVPTLVLWGAHDGLVPRRYMETLAARIPRSVLTVYPDVGHLVLWEDPARVATDASSFFRSLDQP